LRVAINSSFYADQIFVVTWLFFLSIGAVFLWFLLDAYWRIV